MGALTSYRCYRHAATVRSPPLIDFIDVSYRYPGAADRPPALSGVSLSLTPGSLVAVVGANGSGKSTLVRLANGTLLPSDGSVEVDGASTATAANAHGGLAQDMHHIRRAVGVVFQHPDDQIVATSVEEDVAFGPENLGLAREMIRERVDAALAVVGLTGLESREPHLLSGGQKQRLAIAGALAMHPRYVVFDEPTAMLDPQGRREVLAVIERLRDEGHGIMLVTHDLAEVALADRVAVLSCGSKVFDGAPAELFAHQSLAAWGLELPAVSVLVRRLIALGIDIDPATTDPAQIVAVLA